MTIHSMVKSIRAIGLTIMVVEGEIAASWKKKMGGFRKEKSGVGGKKKVPGKREVREN